MSTDETVLRGILEQRAIGAAKIGEDFTRMARRYGEPTEMIDPREFGLDKRCRIWSYDEVQVWSDEYGVIDRVFFSANSRQAKCNNQNFVDDMAALRGTISSCDDETFKQVLGEGSTKTRRTSTWAELSFMGDGIEVYATFVSSDVSGPRCLSMLRLNAVASPTSSRDVIPYE